MAKDELLELTGAVAEVLPNSTFRVQVDGQTHIVLCYMGGRLKKNKIKVILGDRVKIEMSPYDLTKGRIVYRM
jgi:translation initiation factor IF-1